MVLLNLKLLEEVNTVAGLARIRKIPGVVSVKLQFPRETDSALRTFYFVTVRPKKVEHVLQQISSDHAVEFVEIAAKRKLV